MGRDGLGKTYGWWAALLGALVLAGCGEGDGAPAALPGQPALMAMVFPGWAKDHDAVPVRDKEKGKQLLVDPVQLVRLSDRRAVLITRGSYGESSHGTPGVLGAYWFSAKGRKWVLDKRVDEVANLGEFGHFDETKLVTLYPGHYAVSVSFPSAGSGRNDEYFQLFGIGEDKLTPLLPHGGLTSQAVYSGVSAHCEAVFQHAVGKPFELTIDMPEMAECWDEHASWEIKPGVDRPGEMHVKQWGKTYESEYLKMQDEGMENESKVYRAVVRRVSGAMVLRYSDKTGMYQLVSGKNVMTEPER